MEVKDEVISAKRFDISRPGVDEASPVSASVGGDLPAWTSQFPGFFGAD